MPIVSPIRVDGLIDGRQSERAMRVRRGVQGYMQAWDAVALPEVSLKSGLRADLVCLLPKGRIVIVEIKTSIADLRADAKWPGYRAHCDELYFATHPGVPAEIFPEDCGLIVTDGHAAECLRTAPIHPLAAAARKTLTLQCARIATRRLEQAERAANPILDAR